MLFNSIDFAIFMPIVFLIYWALGYYVRAKNISPLPQNLFLLATSYFFYAWWDWRFLSLILICSFTNYGAGLLLMRCDRPVIAANAAISTSKRRLRVKPAMTRKIVLWACCLVCFGILGVFILYAASFCALKLSKNWNFRVNKFFNSDSYFMQTVSKNSRIAS